MAEFVRYSDKSEKKYLGESVVLLPYKGVPRKAVEWYENLELQWLVNGLKRPYSEAEITKMYDYQAKLGELYFIGLVTGSGLALVGDCWLSADDFALVIAPKFQGQGIGSLVLKYFMDLKQNRGDDFMEVQQVYHYNAGSHALFQKHGFKKTGSYEDYCSYRKDLNDRRV